MTQEHVYHRVTSTSLLTALGFELAFEKIVILPLSCFICMYAHLSEEFTVVFYTSSCNTHFQGLDYRQASLVYSDAMLL